MDLDYITTFADPHHSGRSELSIHPEVPRAIIPSDRIIYIQVEQPGNNRQDSDLDYAYLLGFDDGTVLKIAHHLDFRHLVRHIFSFDPSKSCNYLHLKEAQLAVRSDCINALFYYTIEQDRSAPREYELRMKGGHSVRFFSNQSIRRLTHKAFHRCDYPRKYEHSTANTWRRGSDQPSLPTHIASSQGQASPWPPFIPDSFLSMEPIQTFESMEHFPTFESIDSFIQHVTQSHPTAELTIFAPLEEGNQTGNDI